jgi:hypothetical protein
MFALFVATGAKIFLALMAFLAMRLSLSLLDRAQMFDFYQWLDKMEKNNPEMLVWYLGFRFLGIAILFAWIFG